MSTRILIGDCREVLRTLDAESVQAVVTSPPYWGLRSYLPAGHPDKPHEIGSEPTVQEWVDTMVGVMREVRRVLRSDGVAFVNLGDSYATGGGKVGAHPGGGSDGERARVCAPLTPLNRMPMAGLKPKDLIGQPWMLAFALRADGWWLRQEIIWAKANPMPESTRDRCTKSHEHIFLLSKSERYFWDHEAFQEPVNGGSHARLPGNKRHGAADLYEAGDEHHRTKAGLVAYAERQRAKYKTPDGWDTRTGEGGHGQFHAEGREKGAIPPKERGARDSFKREGSKRAAALVPGQSTGTHRPDRAEGDWDVSMRNPRSVWHFPTQPFRGAHFATFPEELVLRCLIGSTREGDTVLDPFGGSGTVGLVCDQMHRHSILIDLDERNLPMARERIVGDAPLFADVQGHQTTIGG